ncbi:hypothetical protein T484DRAFT_1974347 [Baffinella frigidus]|nr:hypothetical protein T484DRAFT_1974347 [Cryptophyta sp. CCMP2293]
MQVPHRTNPAQTPAPMEPRLLAAPPPPLRTSSRNWFDNATAFLSGVVADGSKTVVDSAEALWNTSPREIQGAPTESSSPASPREIQSVPAESSSPGRRSILRIRSDDSAFPSAPPRTRAHTTDHSASAAPTCATSADSLEAKIMAARASSARAALIGSHDSSSFVRRSTSSFAHGRSTSEENQRVRPSSASGRSTPEDDQRVRFSPASSIPFSRTSPPSSLRSSRLQTTVPRPSSPLAAEASRRPPPSISSRSLAPLERARE